MRSAWFWNTPQWEAYQIEYYAGKVRPVEYKSSPLANDHDFYDPAGGYPAEGFDVDVCQTQVLDLRDEDLWCNVRKSYRPLIKKAQREYSIYEYKRHGMAKYQALHAEANGGQPRPNATYAHQHEWMNAGYGLLVGAHTKDMNASTLHIRRMGPGLVAFAYWIVYQDCAYYMSGPSIEDNVQHAVVWASLEILQTATPAGRGVRLVEMGQVDGPGMTEKEKSIAVFKTGFGGEARPFLIARKMITGGASAPAELVRTV